MCDWFFFGQCIWDYVLDFVLVNEWEILDEIIGCICFLFFFSHFVSCFSIPSFCFVFLTTSFLIT